MKKILLSALVIFCFMSVNHCSKDKEKTVLLKANYAMKDLWTYTIEYTSQGVFTKKGSTTTMSTNISGRLSADTKVNPGKLTMTAGDITIASDMLKEEEKQQLVQKLEQARYSLNLGDGYPSVDTAAELPSGGYPEWDLYRQFAKLLPSLPHEAVARGFTWERTVTIPVNTVRGSVPCEIYHYYKLDSLNESTARITWQLRYSADEPAQDSTTIMKQIPIAGTGNGTALLDTKNNIILNAEMNFKTPVATVGEITVDWQEHAVLTFESSK